ncbi:MAG: hypothetical protein ABJ092_12985, partial [Gillisia sp.]
MKLQFFKKFTKNSPELTRVFVHCTSISLFFQLHVSSSLPVRRRVFFTEVKAEEKNVSGTEASKLLPLVLDTNSFLLP